MPATARIPTVQFRSLLLPPIQIPLRALQTLHRPQCTRYTPPAIRAPQCVAQKRSLHLYKTAKARTVLGMHKVLTFDEYNLAAPRESEHRVHLVKSEKDPTLIRSDLSLQELYDDHVKPGQILYLIEGPKKAVAEDQEKLKAGYYADIFKTYALAEPYKIGISSKNTQQPAHQLAGLKLSLFNLASPVEYVKIVLDRSYQFIELGSPVEMRIRVKGKKLTKQERLLPGDAEAWPWLHNHFPHLRPDFILKSMPKDTVYLIKPWTDGRIVQWVMAKKTAKMQHDLNKRLRAVKQSVQSSIEQGKQSQLPSALRQQLYDQGSRDYSPFVGLPREQAREKWRRGGLGVLSKMGAMEKKRMAADAATTQFMVPDHQLDSEAKTRLLYDDLPAGRSEHKQVGLDVEPEIKSELEREVGLESEREVKSEPESTWFRKSEDGKSNKKAVWEGRGKVRKVGR